MKNNSLLGGEDKLNVYSGTRERSEGGCGREDEGEKESLCGRSSSSSFGSEAF